MSLVHGSINNLNVIGARRLSYIPAHFTRMKLSVDRIDLLDQWIYQNLDSRYAIVKGLKMDNDNRVITIHELGIEDSRELTIMSLSCPYLDNKIKI